VWDVTGKANDGVFFFGPTWRTAPFPGGRFPNAANLLFDGIDDYVQFDPRTLPAVEAPKSVSLWARYDYTIEDDPEHPQTLIGLFNRTTAAGVSLGFRKARLMAFTYFQNEIVGVPAPPLGWHHFAYTFDGTTHTLYVDGVSVATSQMAAEVGPVTTCRIGRSSSGVPDAFKGFLDDVRVYNRALTLAEVKALRTGAP
jgi:hypothetical protein